MNFETEIDGTSRDGIVRAAGFPEAASASIPTLEPDDAPGGDQAFDEGVLAEVPYALDAYMSQQCFGPF